MISPGRVSSSHGDDEEHGLLRQLARESPPRVYYAAYEAAQQQRGVAAIINGGGGGLLAVAAGGGGGGGGPAGAAGGAAAAALDLSPRGRRGALCRAAALLLLLLLVAGAAVVAVLAPHGPARARAQVGGAPAAAAAPVAAASLHQQQQQQQQPQPTQYVLIIDAGSSGTRMFAFEWHAPARPGGLPRVRAVPPSAAPHAAPRPADGQRGQFQRVETRPGLDAFAGDPARLRRDALGPLLAWARAVVPAAAAPRAPLLLFGTGGLRRLAPAAREGLLAEVRAVLAESGFRFDDGGGEGKGDQPSSSSTSSSSSSSWARVLHGREEGVYAWLSLNYQAGRLRGRGDGASPRLPGESDDDDSSSGSDSKGAPATLGALDLGGATLQLTFELPPPPHTGSSNERLSLAAGEQQHQHHQGQEPQEQEARGGGGGAAALASSIDGDGVATVTVGGASFRLHTHSFQRFGLNDAFDRGVTLLLQKQQQQQQQQPSATSSATPLLSPSSQPPPPANASGVLGSGALADREQQQLRMDVAAAAAAGVRPLDAAPPPTAPASAAVAPTSGSTVGGSLGGAAARRRARRRKARRRRRLQEASPPSSALPSSTSVAPAASAAAAAALAAGPGAGNASAADAGSSSSSGGAAGGALLPFVEHPCLHDGFQRRYDRLVLHHGGAAPEPPAVLLVGRPDWQACVALADALVADNDSAAVNGSSAAAVAPCTPRPPLRPACRLGAPQPELAGRFAALAGFYVVSSFLRGVTTTPSSSPSAAAAAAGEGGPARGGKDSIAGSIAGGGGGKDGALLPLSGELDEAARQLCARPWRDVARELGGHINVERYCGWGPYVVRLLRTGLRLGAGDVAVASGDVGWPLGAALAEASKLPEMMVAEAPPPPPLPPAAKALAGPDGERGAPYLAGRGRRRHRRSWAQAALTGLERPGWGHVVALFLAVGLWLAAVAACHGAGPSGAAAAYGLPGLAAALASASDPPPRTRWRARPATPPLPVWR